MRIEKNPGAACSGKHAIVIGRSSGPRSFFGVDMDLSDNSYPYGIKNNTVTTPKMVLVLKYNIVH